MERANRAYLFLILLLHILAFFILFRSKLTLDGYYYYYWGHSLVHDFDLQMLNQYVLIPGRMGLPKLSDTGFMANIFPIGQSLVYAPSLILACLIDLCHYSLFSSAMVMELGFFPCFVYLFNTVVLVVLSHILFFILLKKFVSAAIAFSSSSAIFFGTAILGYSYIIPSYSHTLALLCILLLLTTFYHQGLSAGQKIIRYAPVAALLLMVRYQDIVVLLLPLYDCWSHRKQLQRNTVLFSFLIFLIILSPQLVAHIGVNGTISASPNVRFVDLFYGLSQDNLTFFILPRSGLFTLTPVTIFGLIALLIVRMDRQQRMLFLLIIVFSYILITTRNDLFYNERFGIRRFNTCLPFLGLALAYLMDQIRKWTKTYYFFQILVTMTVIYHLYRVVFLLFEGPEHAVFSFRPFLANTVLYVLLNNEQTMTILVKFIIYLGIVGLLGILISHYWPRMRQLFTERHAVIFACAFVLCLDTGLVLSFQGTEKYDYFMVKTERNRVNIAKKRKTVPEPRRSNRARLKALGALSDLQQKHSISMRELVEFPGERYEFGHAFSKGRFYRRHFSEKQSIWRMAVVFTRPTSINHIGPVRQYLDWTIREMDLRVDENTISFKILEMREFITPETMVEDRFLVRCQAIIEVSPPLSGMQIEIAVPEKCNSLRLTGLCIEAKP